ncbi:unnamed protein product [Orchesella dallaii]|uniref:Transporter n=1 Tax=Orchesella dallaii TaxID=48710 RepID=A0ABP1RQ29_9HEXA
MSFSSSDSSSGAPSIDIDIESPRNGSQTEMLEKRGTWASKIPYVLTLIGYTIGFGDVWRFPHIVHSNGGVAFLIPYLIMLFLEGIPLFLVELSIGQRMRTGAAGAFSQISPFLGGIGLTTGVLCYVVGFYYNTLSAWVLAYLFESFRSELPWKNCTTATANQGPDAFRECELSGQASKYYWYANLLKISSGIEDKGEFNWYMAICLVIVWVIIWLIILNGIKTVQVIVYVTATLPIITFMCVLVANHFLEGWEYAYTILWKPDWTVLYDPSVWLVAATQTFFSLGLAFGSLIVFASFMPARNDCYKDAVNVSLINTVISLMAALAIFPVLGSQGYLQFKACEAQQQLINVDEASTPIKCDLEEFVQNSGEGTGLLFIAFAEAANQMPWFPPFWSAFFFFALYAIGINSTFGTIEGAVMTIVDMGLFPKTPRWILTSVVCGSLMGLSMVFASGWGYYILDYFDTYTANWSLLVVAFLEVVSVSWVYGLARFSYDLKLMTGRKPGKFMMICLRFISPVIIVVLLISSVYKEFTSDSGFSYDRYDKEKGDIERNPYPGYVVAIGFLLLMICLVFIPLQAFFAWRKKSLLKSYFETVSDFPEDELREERGLGNNATNNSITNLFDKIEMFIIGKGSIDRLEKYLAKPKKNKS